MRNQWMIERAFTLINGKKIYDEVTGKAQRIIGFSKTPGQDWVIIWSDYSGRYPLVSWNSGIIEISEDITAKTAGDLKVSKRNAVLTKLRSGTGTTTIKIKDLKDLGII